MEWEVIPGGVTAPRGFRAAGVYAGLKKANRDKKDLALIVSDTLASAAAVYTTNKVQAAPLKITREHLASGRARAIVANSGNANACTGEQGLKDARRMAEVTAEILGIKPQEVVVASTGVIGVPLPMDKIEAGIRKAAQELSPTGSRAAAEAILTTDLRVKEIAVRFHFKGSPVVIGGIAKGSGMIHPHMATMLAFLTTDAVLSPEQLKKALVSAVDNTFNLITVDGDTSTNDMVVVLANGLSGVGPTSEEEYRIFAAALEYVCRYLARLIARDGEGASRLIEVEVRGAATLTDARKIARAIAGSNLVKSAVFGADANWGRILCAAGYAGAELDPGRVDIFIESAAGCEQLASKGEPACFDEAKASAILSAEEVKIIVDLNLGQATAVAYGCDLTYDYVKINASYRT
ncbi:MAG: bifunctional glutamate N-acetyltransferase/amino-acid acetyltransferase ArgJ [Thermanaeromonas sp.]|uniref:bifunctional glutamate N-acetyltransferase/amino-acid acetyltransferase ArgJ n=1 Tax=Thermanaeromonas sp. TaxID=2003697 RepID=UPI00243E9D77|nr:bifunctional glutamate N-acetyltransferase/amino-acid acetyltransferase ArgJ [Thermanaeromonas sp.]MCG0277159.1 bifunctional glutamate N-acetyltransferase/amino-acid acetyltransferase ArgJ [Thermanaeromonas sp.]